MSNRATSIDDCRLMTSFESIRQQLLLEQYADRLDKPLAFWVLPNDRRLPLAFLPRKVGDLLHTPFADLTATPGVGHKKIRSLVELLNRAAADTSPAGASNGNRASNGSGAANGNGHGSQHATNVGNGSSYKSESGDQFEPDQISELIWNRWQTIVRSHGLEHEKLGYLAPSLRSLPTVIWYRPLSYYLDKSLHEIRNLKTHGEKRVRGVLEVFCVINRMLSHVPRQDAIAVRLSPRFVVPVDSWITDRMTAERLPSYSEIRDRLCEPLIRQVGEDVSSQLARLSRGRLGLDGGTESVQAQASEMNVTRTRVYQLLDDCSRVMMVRWPEGRCRVGHVMERFRREAKPEDRQSLELLANTVELFFSARHLDS